MQLIDFLPLDNIHLHVDAPSKKRALEKVSHIAANSLKNPALMLPILENLLARERLGSTGIGHGIAIPHCRIEGLTHPLAVLLLLEKGIDYNSIDYQPVDIVLGLLIPTESNEIHLNLLAWIAEHFSQESVLQQMHNAASNIELYQLIAQLSHEFIE